MSDAGPGSGGERAPASRGGARPFTGERLHAVSGAGGTDLFAIDLARHRAAYAHAVRLWRERPRVRSRHGRILDLGCGAGYGVPLLARDGALSIGVDRELPDTSSRVPEARFVRASVDALPFETASFDLVVSFQVIEHLEDAPAYLREIGRVLAPEGVALLTTPNRATSDGLNPYHVREYLDAELRELLDPCFASVEILGVGCSPRVAPYFASRRKTLARIERLDVLRLRHRLPRSLRLWLFARAAVLVRRGLRRGGTLVEADEADFPIGPLAADTLDLLAIVSRARAPHL